MHLALAEDSAAPRSTGYKQVKPQRSYVDTRERPPSTQLHDSFQDMLRSLLQQTAADGTCYNRYKPDNVQSNMWPLFIVAH